MANKLDNHAITWVSISRDETFASGMRRLENVRVISKKELLIPQRTIYV